MLPVLMRKPNRVLCDCWASQLAHKNSCHVSRCAPSFEALHPCRHMPVVVIPEEHVPEAGWFVTARLMCGARVLQLMARILYHVKLASCDTSWKVLGNHAINFYLFFSFFTCVGYLWRRKNSLRRKIGEVVTASGKADLFSPSGVISCSPLQLH